MLLRAYRKSHAGRGGGDNDHRSDDSEDCPAELHDCLVSVQFSVCPHISKARNLCRVFERMDGMPGLR